MTYEVNASQMLGATPAEVILAERIDMVVEMLSRALGAQPGTHYQREKVSGLSLRVLALDGMLERGRGDGVRPEVVTALVATYGQKHWAGRQLWPLATAPELPDGLRAALMAGYARHTQQLADMGIGGDSDGGAVRD